MGGGGKIPYPKHVWSPAGGWYGQPHNWRTNTVIMSGIIAGICLYVGSVSADREHRTRFPEKGVFFPSRLWSREIREHDKAMAAKEAAASE